MDNYNRHDASRPQRDYDQRGDYQRRDYHERREHNNREHNNYERRDYGDRQGGGGNYQRRDYGDRQGGGGNYQRRDYGDRQGGGGNYQRRDYGDRQGGGGYQGGGGNYQRRDYGDRQGGGYQGGGGNYQRRDYGDRQGGGYQRRDYGDRQGGGYQRRDYGDRQGGGYQRRDYGDRQGGGYQRRDYGDRQGGGYQRRDYGDRQGGGYRRQERYDRPRRKSPPIAIPDSPFLLPEHPLTEDFQRAIGMAKGTIVEVDPRKKRGMIEIEGFEYKFEDERKRDLQRKYPIQKFKDREIQFAFWPTYSQKAAQYRKIDEAPTIKIANLRRTLPQPNIVEVIGQVLMVEEALFVMSVFSASQRKKYMVTILGKFPGETGDFIQMFGQLKDGAMQYESHRVVSSDVVPEAAASETEPSEEVQVAAGAEASESSEEE